MYYMTFIDTDEDQKSRTRFTLYVNVDDKLYLEICSDDEPEDMYRYQNTTLNKEDVIKLIDELQRLLPKMK